MRTLAELRPRLESLAAPFPEDILLGFSDIGKALPQSLSSLPRAVTIALRMDDAVMDSVAAGPTAPYYAEYKRINALIDSLEEDVAAEITRAGGRCRTVPASAILDQEGLRGEIPHKTGAIASNLGWIGRNCQLVTHAFGPRLRLGTVLTDMPLGDSPKAAARSFCGDCMACVEACPAKALKGELWTPGMARERLFDARACASWKAARYAEYDGLVCGICASVCPVGSKRRRERR